MSKKVYKLDKKGNLHFTARNQLHKSKYKSDSVWNNTWVLGIIIGFCALADYASFSSLFSAILYDNAFLRGICILGMVVIMEFSPAYVGFNLKKKACGYNVEALAIIVPLLAFILGCAINIILRLATHSLVFPDFSDTATSVIGSSASESGNSSNSIVYAWFFGILPIATSLIAFGASYSMSNPLKQELQKLEKEHIELTDRIDQIDAILEEYSPDEEYLNRLLSEDESKYNAALSMVQNQKHEFFNYARQRISEHLGTPSATSYVVEYPDYNEEAHTR